MSKLTHFLKSQRITALKESFASNQTLLVEELWNSPKALVAALAVESTQKHLLIITGTSQEEMRLFHDFTFFTDAPILEFPSWETLPSENISPSPDIVGERYEVLKQLSNATQPHIILASLQSCLQKLIPPATFQHLSLVLNKGESVFFEELIQKLTAMGYQRKSLAADKGEFAVRGGIIDIFPVSSPDPFRIEFWGDEIESIRVYDPLGQKSIRFIEKIELCPALEAELLRQQPIQNSILDYLGENTLIILDDLLALEDRYASLVGMGSNHPSFTSIEDFLDKIDPLQKILYSSKPIEELTEIKHKKTKKSSFYSQQEAFQEISFQMFHREWVTTIWRHPFNTISGYFFPEEEGEIPVNDLLNRLSALSKESEILFLSNGELEQANLQKRLTAQEVTFSGKKSYQLGYLSSGLVVLDQNYLIFPFTELTGRYKIRRQKLRSTYQSTPIENYDLIPGEIVVHLHHGIGRYLGMERKTNHLGIPSEFLILEYAEEVKFFVPLNQAHLISKYIGANEDLPRLHTFGSPKWKNTKEQTEKAILGYASDLLKSYAEREIKQGFAYPDESEEVCSFEEEFPFVETEDQLAAIASIKEDMKSSKAMDRLICGDVGYGKTEVAMRAAFKAVLDGKKQVAVLVPTTVLAMQHYENFLDRMSNFPINIGVVSRFKTAKEVKKTLEGVSKGSVDILIGTHRMISEDVVFKDLGLVIIDEEQRFGVKAKEHLKKIKVGVDCLTLSATPIPRTLYMSMIGVRDMSIINTPPQDRIPIKTIIAESNDITIKNALMRELARDGQIFFIHNRVESIYGVVSRLKNLVPQARIVVAHGQMDADEIDAAFHTFKSGMADILIATTIVENGIDMPNANTILIDRADHFGLAALYQLRGRVGRWNRRAYAYFMVPNLYRLPEISRKRLQALAESSGFGGGMRIAMRDLEIRGAGDILGTEQSGHVASIGFHLYCKLLKRTILTLQGKKPALFVDTKMEFLIDARIPEEFIHEVSLRMEIYQRLGEATSSEEVDDIWSEIKDRFGTPPEVANNLYHLTRIRVFAGRHGITQIKQDKVSLTIEKQKGKHLETRKILCPKFKTAKEMEEKIIALI